MCIFTTVICIMMHIELLCFRSRSPVVGIKVPQTWGSSQTNDRWDDAVEMENTRIGHGQRSVDSQLVLSHKPGCEKKLWYPLCDSLLINSCLEYTEMPPYYILSQGHNIPIIFSFYWHGFCSFPNLAHPFYFDQFFFFLTSLISCACIFHFIDHVIFHPGT